MKPADKKAVAPVRVSLRGPREMTVRLLRTDDAEAIVEFYGSIPPEDNRYYIGPESTTPACARKRAAMADDDGEVALILDGGDGKIYGEAWYRWQGDDAPQSTFGICIRRACQNIGAGKAITARLLEIARDYGPRVMTLTVQKENARAVALYTAAGFKVIREQTRPAGADCPPLPEYYMELSLPRRLGRVDDTLTI